MDLEHRTDFVFLAVLFAREVGCLTASFGTRSSRKRVVWFAHVRWQKYLTFLNYTNQNVHLRNLVRQTGMTKFKSESV